ncbi:MAG: hypothetical protein QXF24_06470, partial [Thermoproteota archaeon]
MFLCATVAVAAVFAMICPAWVKELSDAAFACEPSIALFAPSSKLLFAAVPAAIAAFATLSTIWPSWAGRLIGAACACEPAMALADPSSRCLAAELAAGVEVCRISPPAGVELVEMGWSVLEPMF